MKKRNNVKIWVLIISIILIFIIYFGINNFNIDFSLSSSTVMSSNNYNGITSTNIVEDSQLLSINSECIPDSGYNICVFNKDSNEKASVRTEIMMNSNIKEYNNYKNGYYIGDVVLPVKFEGDKFYLYESKGITTWTKFWDSFKCNDNGCNGFIKELDKIDEIILANIGDSYSGCPTIVAFDYDYEERSSSGTTWWWSLWNTKGYGWIDSNGDNKCLDIKSVECYDNTDCNSNFYCNKNGNWQDWKCELKECENKEESCNLFNFELCEDYKWVDKNLILGKCNVNCIDDFNCKNLNNIGENYCKDNNVYINKTVGFCNTQFYNCESSVSNELLEECLYGCNDAECIIKECDIGETKCDGFNYNTCKDYKWFDNGLNLGKCETSCLNNDNCNDLDFMSDNYCIENQIFVNKSVGVCDINSYTCNQINIVNNISDCEFGCLNGECINENNINYFYVIGGSLAFIIVIIGGILIA